MKISARAAAILAVVFSAICFAVAFSGFTSLAEIADPLQRADTKGFAWFWTFLGAVGVTFGVLSWWIARTARD